MAVPSSSGGTGAIAAFGRGFVRASDVTLTASDLPTQAFGYFITSRTQGFVAHPSGSAGNLCILGSIGRCVGLGQVQDTGSSSSFSLRLDLAMTPTPTGLVSVSVGETWTFQAWHHDTLTGAPTSNFSDAIEISLY